jgi:hypothetical protein
MFTRTSSGIPLPFNVRPGIKSYRYLIKKSVGKPEQCMYEQGDPVPAEQQHDNGQHQQQVDQYLYEWYFLPVRFKINHFPISFVSQ